MPVASLLPAEGLYDDGLPITEVFGLPVHPLVVHGAVVLLPLASIGLLLMVTSAARGKRYGALFTGLSFVAWIFSLLAVFSGRDLKAALGYTGDNVHFVWGGWLPWAGLAVFGTTLLLWLTDRRGSGRNVLGFVLTLVGFVVALGTIAATVYVGHAGAGLTWGA